MSDLLRAQGMKPHLTRTYKVSRDPQFADKVTDVVGLYLNPPDHAIVLCVDEKTSIQALQRTQPPLPLRAGRAVRHTHDYRRHGVVDLFAALEVATGQVTHRFSNTHTASDFLCFMNKVARAYPARPLHVILDNSSTHNTQAVRDWLADHPRVTFHYTPTSASWLNQIEGFFGILAKQALSLTDFASKRALRDHLVAYLRRGTGTRRPLHGQSPPRLSFGHISECVIASRRGALVSRRDADEKVEATARDRAELARTLKGFDGEIGALSADTQSFRSQLKEAGFSSEATHEDIRGRRLLLDRQLAAIPKARDLAEKSALRTLLDSVLADYTSRQTELNEMERRVAEKESQREKLVHGRAVAQSWVPPLEGGLETALERTIAAHQQELIATSKR